MEASAPTGPFVEPEPREWQPRTQWLSARLLCGAVAFFFMSFLFAYFYLRSLDVNKSWKIGAVNPSIGLGVTITVVLVTSAALLRIAARRPNDEVRLGSVALVLVLAAMILQVVEWTTLGFGPASGGYASVFIGWTSMNVLFELFGLYWIETQVATAWRARREGPGFGGAELMVAGIEACSFYWAFFVGIGVVAFAILYLV
jgi:heme/copper-type cytochrome/quinol oxidase subunit 3